MATFELVLYPGDAGDFEIAVIDAADVEAAVRMAHIRCWSVPDLRQIAILKSGLEIEVLQCRETNPEHSPPCRPTS